MTRADLDNIFAKAKKTSSGKSITKSVAGPGPVSARTGKKVVSGKLGLKSSNPKNSGSSSDPFALTERENKKSLDLTEEGWKIYTPEELSIGKGGETADCPFDCNCCF
jgi:hypothetical protein